MANLVRSKRKGLAFGWYNLAIDIAALPSSLLFGWLYEDFGPLVAFDWGAGLALFAAFLLLRARKRIGPPKPKPRMRGKRKTPFL